MTPAPRARDQDAALALVRRLDPYVRSNGIGHLGIAPANLALEGDQLAQPDVYVVPMVGGRAPPEWKEYGIPGSPIPRCTHSPFRFRSCSPRCPT